jgi:hypothetical protein
METSLFERAGKHIANGAWLYKEVIVNNVFRFFELNFSMTSSFLLLMIVLNVLGCNRDSSWDARTEKRGS